MHIRLLLHYFFYLSTNGYMDMRLSKRLLALSPLDGLIHSSLLFFLVLILLSIISSYIDKIH
jgi:hypothetical protein